jgi:hypothetical protein
MRPEDLLEMLRKRPFEPFRIRLSNGETYEVRHPELAMVGQSAMAIGVPRPNARHPMYDRLVTVALLHINQVEPIAAPPQPTP